MNNITYVFLKFIMVKRDSLDVVSHSIMLYKNISTMLNEALL